MSVPNDTILSMKQQWLEHTWVCDTCDALYKVSSLKKVPPCFQGGCQSEGCKGHLQLVSVVDVTLAQSTDHEDEEEQMHETFVLIDPAVALRNSVKQELELMYENEITELKNSLFAKNNLISRDFSRVVELKSYILEVYDESSDKEALIEIANIFGIELTKSIQWVATIKVQGTVDVDLTRDYELYNLVHSELSVDGNGSVIIDDYDTYSVEEA